MYLVWPNYWAILTFINSATLTKTENIMQTSIENLNKFAAATNNDLFDPEYEGGSWLVRATVTLDTLENFISAADDYLESNKPVTGKIAGFPFVFLGKVQVRKGDQRQYLSVIDFGDFRYAIKDDLTNY